MNCPQCDLYCAPGTRICDCGYVFEHQDPEKAVEYSKKKKSSDSIFSRLFALKGNIVLKVILLIALLVFLITYFLKDRLPQKEKILHELYREPAQTRTRIPPSFEVTQKGFVYTVTPLFNYELYGMVVSYHHSNEFLDTSHERWNDYLNIKDICVIWGKNIFAEAYRHMDFWSRDFTCFYEYSSQEVGKLFTEECLSNNHILAHEKSLRGKIMSVRKGDQIYIKGYLSSYSHKKSGFKRGTSTSRKDRGNGACETIYVTDFKVLRRANKTSRFLNKLSVYSAILCLILLLIDLHRSQAANKQV